MKRRSRGDSESGAAVLEAAATLLLVMILLFGVMEVGRLINIQHTLTNAAREGARFAVLPPQSSGTPPVPSDALPNQSAVQSKVQGFLDANGLNGATATIVLERCCEPPPASCPDVPPCATGITQYSRVTVTVPYRVISISMFGLLEFNMHGHATMRNETNLK